MLVLAFLVDALVYAALATAFVLIARKRLPRPWSEFSFTIPFVVVCGLILSLMTYPVWLFRPV